VARKWSFEESVKGRDHFGKPIKGLLTITEIVGLILGPW
jgi:hypothetical protein